MRNRGGRDVGRCDGCEAGFEGGCGALPGAMVPEDIAPTVVFLLTPGSLAVTGQVLPVNNGFVFT